MPRIIAASLAQLFIGLVAFAADPANSLSQATDHPLEFIDTSFENASPVWYDFAPDGSVLVHLLYDHERSSPNRAAGHIHLQLQSFDQPRMSSANAAFDGWSSGSRKLHSMLHNRTMTLGRGLSVFGGLRVY